VRDSCGTSGQVRPLMAQAVRGSPVAPRKASNWSGNQPLSIKNRPCKIHGRMARQKGHTSRKSEAGFSKRNPGCLYTCDRGLFIFRRKDSNDKRAKSDRKHQRLKDRQRHHPLNCKLRIPARCPASVYKRECAGRLSF
jgi:hypothetical protein